MIKPIGLVEPKKVGANKLEPIKVPSFQGKIDYDKLNKTFATGVDIAADYIKKGFNYVVEKTPGAIETGKQLGKDAIAAGRKYGAKALEAGKSAIESTYKFFQDLKTK
ncbi:hypothetical protein IJC60_03245 [bacterium]|nr:hypothetical protein [bacterium]